MPQKCPQRSFPRNRRHLRSPQTSRGKQRCHVPGRDTLSIALVSAYLPGQKYMGILPERQIRVQKLGRVQVGVAVNAAEAQEFGIGQTGDHPEHPLLFGNGKTGLESHHIVALPRNVLFSQLTYREGAPPGARISQPDGTQRTERETVVAPLSHHLDRKTRLEKLRMLERTRHRAVCLPQSVIKRLVLLLGKGTVDIIPYPAFPAGSMERYRHVDGICIDDGSYGIVEMKINGSKLPGHPRNQLLRCKRSRSYNTQRRIPRRTVALRPEKLDKRFLLYQLQHLVGKQISVNRKSATGRNAGLLRRIDKRTVEKAQLGLEQTVRRRDIAGLERIGTDKLRRHGGEVGRRRPQRARLIQFDTYTKPGEGQGRFRSGKPRSYYGN